MSGRKFCTSCQASRELEGGVSKKVNKTTRWVCKLCLEHKTESLYSNKSGRAADVGKLMKALYGGSK